MQRNRPPSAQTISVLRALAAAALPGHRNRRLGRGRSRCPAPRQATCTDAAGPVHPDRKPWHRRGGV